MSLSLSIYISKRPKDSYLLRDLFTKFQDVDFFTSKGIVGFFIWNDDENIIGDRLIFPVPDSNKNRFLYFKREVINLELPTDDVHIPLTFTFFFKSIKDGKNYVLNENYFGVIGNMGGCTISSLFKNKNKYTPFLDQIQKALIYDI